MAKLHVVAPAEQLGRSVVLKERLCPDDSMQCKGVSSGKKQEDGFQRFDSRLDINQDPAF